MMMMMAMMTTTTAARMATQNSVIKHSHHHRRRHRHCEWHHVLSVRITVLLLAACLPNPVLPEVIYRVDPLALLAATLRTYQRAGCDSEQLSLSCPRGTSISIELAQYGRAGDLSDHSLCPPASQEDLTTTGSSGSGSSDAGGTASLGNGGDGGVGVGGGVIHSGTEIEVKPPETCTVSGLQYALLQTVVDACQKKRHCKFAANSKTLANEDPCSGIRKFVEIAYKCRPYEFRSKVACENDNMPLVCNPYSRIAIYSASFGHTERESVQCGHGNMPQDNLENSSKPTCLASYATETVMQICHGRRRCAVTADAGTFGRPCKGDVRLYLKVVYTCIPRKVLKDRYETAPEMDEPQQSDLDLDQDELYDEDQFYKESEAIPPAPKLQGALPNPVMPFDFGGSTNDPTSTRMPPMLSRNDNSLEDRLLSSVDLWLRNQIDPPIDENISGSEYSPEHQKMQTTSNAFADTAVTLTPTATATVTVTASVAAGAPAAAATGVVTDVSLNLTSNETLKNFFYKRKCQMEDDWGSIGLNCTNEDIIIERVEVIGFIANWLQAYDHIRKNQEQFYLYLIISVVAGVVLCLTLVIGRLTLQRRRSSRKSSTSGAGSSDKNFGELNTAIAMGRGNSEGGGKFQEITARETQLSNTYCDDISEIDGDIDLNSPMPVPSFASRNEAYMTYAPTPSCTYDGPLATSMGKLPPAGSAVLMPASHHSGLLISAHASQTGTKAMACSMGGGGVGVGVGGPGSGVGGIGSRQPTPPPGTLYASMSACSPVVSGAMTMGPHMLTPSGLGTIPQHSTASVTPSYLTGTIMVPGHQHPHSGTLRRTLIPTSVGMMAGTSVAPPSMGYTVPHSMAGIQATAGVYYDSTVPRNLSRGLSADSPQYFLG